MRRTLTTLALVAAFTATASAGATLELETVRKEEPRPMYPGMPAPAGGAKTITTKTVVKAEGKKIHMTVPSDEDPSGTSSSINTGPSATNWPVNSDASTPKSLTQWMK